MSTRLVSKSLLSVMFLLAACSAAPEPAAEAPSEPPPSSGAEEGAAPEAAAPEAASEAAPPAAQPAALECLPQVLAEDLAHRVAFERPEDHHAIDAIEELGAKRVLDLPLYRGFAEMTGPIREAETRAGGNQASQVRGHDHDRIPEIYFTTQTVR